MASELASEIRRRWNGVDDGVKMAFDMWHCGMLVSPLPPWPLQIWRAVVSQTAARYLLVDFAFVP